MRRRTFIGLLTGAVAQAQDPTQSTSQTAAPQFGFTIAGVVVNGGANAPMAKALVQIASTINRNEHLQVVTGTDGRFSFTNLPAHKFALTVTRPGGFPQAYLSHDNYSSAIVTGPDQDTTQIVFRFHPPGVLTGRVLDESNDPVRSAQIHLFAHAIDNSGNRRLVQAGGATTSTSGQFRVGRLASGTYIVGVSARPWFAQHPLTQHLLAQQELGPRVVGLGRGSQTVNAPKADPQFDVTYPFTYYPNAVEPGSASPITVTDGNESAVQINLRAVPAIHVRLTGGESRQGNGTNVQVSLLGPENLLIPVNAGAFAQEGQGELTGLSPGRYQLSINTFRAPAARDRVGDPEEGPGAPGVFTKKIVDLVDGATVDLSAASHVAVKATVTVTGTEHPTNRIGLALRDRRTGSGSNAMAGPDGILHFPEAGLSPGRYAVSLSNTPVFHIISFEAKGAKVTGGELVIEDGADVQLSVTIGRRSSIKLEGFAVNDNHAVIGAMILLLPKAAAIGATIYRDQSDSDGSFAFAGVSSGNYLAIAIDDGRDLAYGDSAALKPYMAAAQTVTVNESVAPTQLRLPVQQRLSQSG